MSRQAKQLFSAMLMIAAVWGLLLLTAAALGGCSSNAEMTVGRGMLVEGQSVTGRYSGPDAWFMVDENGRQIILLAFEPTPGGDGPSHRRYLQIVVGKGGGQFIGHDATMAGPVFDKSYTWEAGNSKPQVDFALLGSRIVTDTVPVSAMKVDHWWTTGHFDLRMSGETRIKGKFSAGPDADRVRRFLQQQKL
jgi:hypothetical protein